MDKAEFVLLAKSLHNADPKVRSRALLKASKALPNDENGLYDLTDADFSGVDLSGLYIGNIDFSGANFSGCKLQRANLNMCLLCRANLSEADLSQVQISYSNFTGANLSKAILEEAFIIDSYLDCIFISPPIQTELDDEEALLESKAIIAPHEYITAAFAFFNLESPGHDAAMRFYNEVGKEFFDSVTNVSVSIGLIKHNQVLLEFVSLDYNRFEQGF